MPVFSRGVRAGGYKVWRRIDWTTRRWWKKMYKTKEKWMLDLVTQLQNPPPPSSLSLEWKVKQTILEIVRKLFVWNSASSFLPLSFYIYSQYRHRHTLEVRSVEGFLHFSLALRERFESTSQNYRVDIFHKITGQVLRSGNDFARSHSMW